MPKPPLNHKDLPAILTLDASGPWNKPGNKAPRRMPYLPGLSSLIPGFRTCSMLQRRSHLGNGNPGPTLPVLCHSWWAPQTLGWWDTGIFEIFGASSMMGLRVFHSNSSGGFESNSNNELREITVFEDARMIETLESLSTSTCRVWVYRKISRGMLASR